MQIRNYRRPPRRFGADGTISSGMKPAQSANNRPTRHEGGDALSRLLKRLFSQTFIVSFLLLLQISLIVVTLLRLNRSFVVLTSLLNILSVLVVLYIIARSDNPTYKLAWIVPIMVFPLFGGLFYLVVQLQKLTKGYQKRLAGVFDATKPVLAQDPGVLDKLAGECEEHLGLARYMNRCGGYPLSLRTSTRYLPTGEIKWKVMLEELEKAKRYIFLEYFIIKEGEMWDSVFAILKRKAAEGVDVRVMYDGVGSGSVLPYKYFRTLRSYGIQAKVFSPFVPFLSVLQNNRDHRKICVVDGVSAICGGINLGDEYVNIEKRFGHWKDSSILLRGDAAYTFSILFLQMWLLSGSVHEDFEKFRPLPEERAQFQTDGFVAPYGDCPLDSETVGKFVYLDIINTARRYLYITTPYVILDNEMITALSLAAKRGVDVKILAPHIPDKWYAYSVAFSYFDELIQAGVEIYRYMPGFIHSKTFVCDDEVAVVGSINLDYRSLYLHYECAVWMHGSRAVKEVYDDFAGMLARDAAAVTLIECREQSIFRRTLNALLRLFAPLM